MSKREQRRRRDRLRRRDRRRAQEKPSLPMPNLDPKQVAAGVKRATDGGCAACGGTVEHVAAFIPNEPWRYWEAAPVAGKTRAIFYGLCDPCREGGAADRIEAGVKRNPIKGPVALASDIVKGEQE